MSQQVVLEYGENQKLTCFETLCEVLNGEILILERGAVLVIEPAQLLENLCVAGIVGNDTLISVLCAYMLVKAKVRRGWMRGTDSELTSFCCSYT